MTTMTPIIPPIRTPVDKRGPEARYKFTEALIVPNGVGAAVGVAIGFDVADNTKLIGALVGYCCTSGERVARVTGIRVAVAGLSVEVDLAMEGLFEGVEVGTVNGDNKGASEVVK